MGKILRMTLVVVTTKKPVAILFVKTNPSDDDVMETLANMIQDNMETSQDLNVDECFAIQRIPIEEDEIEE